MENKEKSRLIKYGNYLFITNIHNIYNLCAAEGEFKLQKLIIYKVNFLHKVSKHT